MLEFKGKGIHVVAGTDMIQQIVVTNDGGKSFAMSYDMFKELFEPTSEDAVMWLKALEQRFQPPSFGMMLEKDDDGNVIGIKAHGKPPS